VKKTGKSGLGHLKKIQKMSQKMLRDRLRLALATAGGTKNAGCKPRRRCA
jgi:hypothetical protein